MKEYVVHTAASGRHAGFTILEVLAAIGIIALLAGLLLPALSKARTHTKRMAAKTEAKQIETAWGQFLSEYQQWPSNTTDKVFPLTGGLLRIFQAEGMTPVEKKSNPKAIPFMHFVRVDASSNPVSPWYKPGAVSSNYFYYCKFDHDYNQLIPGTGNTSNPPMNDVKRPVIVWTYNRDAKPGDADYVVGSWAE